MNTKNVTIRGNTFLNIGEAVKPQSIFMRANYVDALGVQNPFRFENVLIEGNVIVAMHAHAISVTDVDGLTVRNNTLIFAGDFTIPPPQVTVPGISYGMADNVRVYDNIIPNRTNYPVSDTPEFYNNLIYSVTNGEIVNILRNPFSTMPDRDSFATFANPEDSADGWRKLGALSVSQKSSTIPLFTSKMEIRNGKIEALLDARHSLPAKGKSLDGAQYEWIFEDGSSANGKLVSKSFVSAGTQSIELRITESDGTLTVLKKQGIFIPATSVLDLNFENPAEKSSPLGPAIAIGDFKKVVSNGNFVEVGGERGHIYLPPNDSNLSILTSTKELSVSLSIRAISEQNTSAIPLITKHGAWGLRLDAVRNTLQLATGSSRFSL
ncbi:MAG: PKD domain-containing protein, partial [Pirellula sp.]